MEHRFGGVNIDFEELTPRDREPARTVAGERTILLWAAPPNQTVRRATAARLDTIM
jgi:hypothetical protein